MNLNFTNKIQFFLIKSIIEREATFKTIQTWRSK